MIVTILLCGLLAGTTVSVKMGILLAGSAYSSGNDTFPAALVAIEEIKNWEKPIDIDLRVEYDNCDIADSYTAAHKLLRWGADVIIGPTCTIVCGPVALMAKEYGVPVISFICSGIELSNRGMYPNFARTAESMQGAAKFLREVFEMWEFELFSIITTTQKINLDIAIEFATEMGELTDSKGDQLYRLQQLKTVVADLVSQEDSVKSGTVKQLDSFLSTAWVYFLPMYDGDAYFILENSAEKIALEEGIDAKDAWQKTNYAWFRCQSVVLPGEEKYYNGVFSLENDKPHITYESEFKSFLEKFDDADQLIQGKAESFQLYLAYFYNAVIAWATAYNNIGSTDYKDIMGALNNLEYTGAYRKEFLGSLAEPTNAIWNMKQYQDNKFVEVASRLNGVEGKITIHHDKIKWPNGDIIDPCKDDVCSAGTSNDAVLYIVVGVCAFLVLAVVAAAVFIVYRNKRKSEEDKKIPWKILFSELDFTVKKSLAGSRRFVQEEPVVTNSSVAKYGHSYVVVKMLTVPNINVTKELLDDLYLLKKAVHPNLTLFHGLCDEPGNCAFITEYCAKGPLKDIIHDDSVQLDWMFKLSLISDIAKGLKHLHQSNFGFHGDLNPSICMVDSHWVCKLTEFGIKNINRESPDASQNNITHEHNKGAHPRDLFYAAPEKLWPSSRARTPKEMQKCDTYSFSIIMYELFAREEPYDTSEFTPEKIVLKVRNRETPLYRPNLDLLQITEISSYELVEKEDSHDYVPSEAVKLMKQCWMEMPFERNNMSDTVQELEDMNPDRLLSITDRVVKMMEKYSEDLESKVAQKTQELESRQTEKNLCSRYLPRKVIERIEEGLEVESVSRSQVTAACVRIRILDNDTDHLSVFNSFEAINRKEIEKRNIYQVLDSNGSPMVISGLYNEGDATEQILDYVMSLQTIATPSKMFLKIVTHTGMASGGLLSTDSSNPRLCITGEIVNDAEILMDQIDFEQILLTEEVRNCLPKDVTTRPHRTIKLTNDKTVETFFLDHRIQQTSGDPKLNPTPSTLV